jgi:Pyruvate/2-oxoacid:ferredoxin oxidoreductase delta subunit
MKVETIEDVVRWRLCVGCGVCAYWSKGGVRMADDPEQGHRPVVEGA